LGLEAGDLGTDALKSAVSSLSARGLRLLSFHSRLISLQSDEIGDLRSRLASAESQLSSVSDSLNSREASVAAQSAAISRLERELAAKTAAISALQADNESKTAAISALQAEVDARTSAAARLEGALSSKSKEVLALHAELQGKSNSLICPKEVFADSVVGSAYWAAFDSWLSPTRPMVLLYRGMRDGFEEKDFHSLCDNKGATVVLVRSSDG
jgi:hypothetical protein